MVKSEYLEYLLLDFNNDCFAIFISLCLCMCLQNISSNHDIILMAKTSKDIVIHSFKIYLLNICCVTKGHSSTHQRVCDGLRVTG